MNSLFAEYDTNTTLAKIIEESTGYAICKEEHFSEYLCRECTNIILDFRRFKKTFHEATEYFKSLTITGSIGGNTKDLSVNIANNDSKAFFTASETEQKEIETHLIDFNSEHETENSENLDNCAEIFDAGVLDSKQEFKQSKKVKCQFCDICFISTSHVNRHEREVHQKKPRKKNKQAKPLNVVSTEPHSKKFCKVCKNIFPEDEFILHFETHKIHICNTCGHRFVRKTDLNDHLETHLDVCKYICQHCGKAFKVRTVLNKHKKIHTNPREEICDVCGQRFNTRDTLKTHYKLKHTKSRDFQCNLCGLAFALKSTLEKHIERHNPDRQRIYSCHLCNVSYINKYNLSRHHVIKHTAYENRPICEFCGKEYVNKINLVRHLKRHHQQEKSKKEWREIKCEDN